MASATETATATKLKLDPPEALQPMTTAEASGLVPLKTEEVGELDRKVAQFVDEFSNGLMLLIACQPALCAAPFHHLRAA